jgi:hypothetical protein
VTAIPAVAPILGSTMPRLWTPPLIEGPPGPCGCGCSLTPETSFGFDVDDFARDVLGTPLDPWQRWLVIHAGELLPDGRPRFRVLLVLVARQNGKTTILRVLTLWWLFVDLVKAGESAVDPVTILGTSSKLDYAKESWESAVRRAQKHADLADEIPKDGVRKSNGEQTLTTTHNTRYKIAAANDDAGRSLTVARLVLDELRQHHDWNCWNAAEPTTSAVPDAQIWALSNQGSATSVVLNALRTAMLQFIDTGEGDPRAGLFEYSAPDGADPTDLAALAQANPNLGRRLDVEAMLGKAIRAKVAGGKELAGFRTEAMCQSVDQLDSAIDPDAWRDCGTDTPTDLSAHRRNVALCVDLALDGSHATLAAAAAVNGVVHVEIVRHWEGQGATRALREELPGIVARIKPGCVGWFPNGPAAAVAAELAERKGGAWPPPYVKLEEIRTDVAAVCMGLAELVTARQARHPRDPLLDAHIRATQRTRRADAWVFGRQDSGGPIDAAYAAAGAAHLARTMVIRARPKVVTRGREKRLRSVE